MGWIRRLTSVLVLNHGLGPLDSLGLAAQAPDAGTWKSYTNNRFGFSIWDLSDWRLGNPMPDETGITLSPATARSRSTHVRSGESHHALSLS